MYCICLARGWSVIGQGIVSILLADARNVENVLDLSDGFGAEEKHIKSDEICLLMEVKNLKRLYNKVPNIM